MNRFDIDLEALSGVKELGESLKKTTAACDLEGTLKLELIVEQETNDSGNIIHSLYVKERGRSEHYKAPFEEQYVGKVTYTPENKIRNLKASGKMFSRVIDDKSYFAAGNDISQVLTGLLRIVDGLEEQGISVDNGFHISLSGMDYFNALSISTLKNGLYSLGQQLAIRHVYHTHQDQGTGKLKGELADYGINVCGPAVASPVKENNHLSDHRPADLRYAFSRGARALRLGEEPYRIEETTLAGIYNNLAEAAKYYAERCPQDDKESHKASTLEILSSAEFQASWYVLRGFYDDDKIIAFGESRYSEFLTKLYANQDKFAGFFKERERAITELGKVRFIDSNKYRQKINKKI